MLVRTPDPIRIEDLPPIPRLPPREIPIGGHARPDALNQAADALDGLAADPGSADDPGADYLEVLVDALDDDVARILHLPKFVVRPALRAILRLVPAKLREIATELAIPDRQAT